MNIFGRINFALRSINIDPSFLKKYTEPHRFYHNLEHIESLLTKAKNYNQKLFLAILFHDIVYDPKRNDNEEKSVELFKELFKGKELSGHDEIIQAILDTKTHKPTPGNKTSEDLCRLDTDILYNSTMEEFIDFEKKIFKEYQWVDYNIYKEKRIEILQNLGTNLEFVNYVKYRDPKIALYPGSFNPFHTGHWNILHKANQIFDKVIIARGINPAKQNELKPLPKAFNYYQCEEYNLNSANTINSLERPENEENRSCLKDSSKTAILPPQKRGKILLEKAKIHADSIWRGFQEVLPWIVPEKWLKFKNRGVSDAQIAAMLVSYAHTWSNGACHKRIFSEDEIISYVANHPEIPRKRIKKIFDEIKDSGFSFCYKDDAFLGYALDYRVYLNS